MQGDRLHRGLFIATLTLGIAFAFVAHARGEWVWDDVYLIEKNRQLVEPGGLWSILTRDLWGGATGNRTQLYHPVPMALLWVEARAFGVNIVAMRLTSVMLHVASGVMLHVACRRRFALSEDAARLATIVFLLHPSATEPVMWLTGSHDLTGVAFASAALLASPLSLGAPRRWRLRVVLVGALTALAFLSKELFVVVPGLLALEAIVLVVRHRTLQTGLRQAIATVAASAAGVAAVVALRSRLGIATGSDQVTAPLADQLRAAGTILAHYGAQLATFGNGRTTHVWSPLPLGASLLVLAFVLALLGGLAVVARRGSTRAGVALFGCSWACVALAPNVVALPTIGMFGNRYAYLPLFGFALLCAAGYDAVTPRLSGRAPRAEVAWRLVPLGLAGALALATAGEATSWVSGVTLFGADVERAPEDPRALYHYGYAVYRRQGCSEALPFYRRAVHHDPGYQRAWHNVAGCLINERRFHEAVPAAERAVALAPHDGRAEFNLGLALASDGRLREGIRHLERAHELNPAHAATTEELARARAALGNP